MRLMPGPSLMRFINPWKYRRDEQARRVDALRARDGDCCRRCRRPIRFDLPIGHDLGLKFEEILAGVEPTADPLANQCLTHGRCNVPGQDHTGAVFERLRPVREAELFAKARSKRKAA